MHSEPGSLKPGHVVKEISYRKLKSIDFDPLRSDLEKSKLCTRDFSNLCELTSSYNSALSSLLEKHAPPLKKTVISRQRVPRFNSDIKGAIRARRRAERRWRNTNSQQDLPALKVAGNHTTYLMNSAHRDYFSNFIAENCSNQRKLFRTTNSLLFEPISFPDHIPMIWLIIFATILYRIKIERINDSLDALQSSEPFDGDGDASADNMGACANCVDPDPCECVEFPSFKTLTQDQVSLITGKAAMKSCPLDPAPTSVVLQVLDVLLPVITCMINMSFESGLFAEEWRQTPVLPTLKKCGLDIAYKNFRPVSNLPYISKLFERAAADQ